MKKKKYTTPLVAYADIVPTQMIATSQVSEQVISNELWMALMHSSILIRGKAFGRIGK